MMSSSTVKKLRLVSTLSVMLMASSAYSVVGPRLIKTCEGPSSINGVATQLKLIESRGCAYRGEGVPCQVEYYFDLTLTIASTGQTFTLDGLTGEAATDRTEALGDNSPWGAELWDGDEISSIWFDPEYNEDTGEHDSSKIYLTSLSLSRRNSVGEDDGLSEALGVKGILSTSETAVTFSSHDNILCVVHVPL